LQNAGGTYGLVALSSSVGCYQGGRFGRNVPVRVVQPTSKLDISTDVQALGKIEPGMKMEVESRKRRRQANLPSVCMSYEVHAGCSHGKMRVTVCWREVLYDDDAGGHWIQENLQF
jgi:hypothetical protein